METNEMLCKYFFFILVYIIIGLFSLDVVITSGRGINTTDVVVSVTNDSNLVISNDYGRFIYSYKIYYNNYKDIKLNDKHLKSHSILSLIDHVVSTYNEKLFNKLGLRRIYFNLIDITTVTVFAILNLIYFCLSFFNIFKLIGYIGKKH